MEKEELEEYILEIAEIIASMHKPEYATFFINKNSAFRKNDDDDGDFIGHKIDGYEFAERIKETVDNYMNDKNNGERNL